MEWAKFVFEVGFALARVVIEALSRGDTSVLDRSMREILPAELRTTLARRAAEAEAAALFAGMPNAGAPQLDALDPAVLASPAVRAALRAAGWVPPREDEPTRETKVPR